MEVAVVPYITMLPEPMIFPWTAKVAEGVVVATPTLPTGSTINLGVLVPTVNKPAKVVVPMPILGPFPELT